jgi:hypothetical protein
MAGRQVSTGRQRGRKLRAGRRVSRGWQRVRERMGGWAGGEAGKQAVGQA